MLSVTSFRVPMPDLNVSCYVCQAYFLLKFSSRCIHQSAQNYRGQDFVFSLHASVNGTRMLFDIKREKEDGIEYFANKTGPFACCLIQCLEMKNVICNFSLIAS